MIEDRKGIQVSLIKKEIGEFVEDIQSGKSDLKGKKGIGIIAVAVAEEILNLFIYLNENNLMCTVSMNIQRYLNCRPSDS